MQPNRTSRTRRAGMTMIEIMLVLAIMGILVSMVLVAASALSQGGRKKATRMLISRIEAAIEQYNEVNGSSWARDVVPNRNYVCPDNHPVDPPPVVTDTQVQAAREANKAITKHVLMGTEEHEFGDAIVQVGTDYYIVDPWFNAEDPDRDLDNHMIWFARVPQDLANYDQFPPGPADADDIDIWSPGPNGYVEVLQVNNMEGTTANERMRAAQQEVGDDIVNWDTGK